MDRHQYSQCVGDRMRGLKVTPQERKGAFCRSAKICSGKASSDEEAARMCEISASQPKAPRASKGTRRAPAKGGMRLVLLTTTDCKPCAAAKQFLKSKLDKGLIQELNIQKSDEGADLAAKFGFNSVPKLLVLDEEGKPFSELQITDNEQTL